MAIKKCLLIILALHTFLANGQRSKKFFKKDYKYIPESESFYKVHTKQKTWQEAKKRCELEGATLFYPENEIETEAVISFWNTTQPQVIWVYIGVSDLVAKEVFETIDGRPILDVYNNWAPGEPNDADGNEDCVILYRNGLLNDDKCDRLYTFICKKTLDSLDWNTVCNLPDNDYVYESSLGRCYKFHTDPKDWTSAVVTCSVEQSYLAVINSEAEAMFLKNFTEHRPVDKIKTNDYLDGAVHLGFHNKDGNGWKTIKGTSLHDSGYAVWGGGQPDGGDKERCGTMFFNGQLNDITCDRKCLFICEHEIGILSQSYDDRFSNYNKSVT